MLSTDSGDSLERGSSNWRRLPNHGGSGGSPRVFLITNHGLVGCFLLGCAVCNDRAGKRYIESNPCGVKFLENLSHIITPQASHSYLTPPLHIDHIPTIMKLSCVSLSVALLSLVREAYTLPIAKSSSVLRLDNPKRSEAGAENDGANFPDPCILTVNDVWYSFATRTRGSSIHIQVSSSTDFENWKIEYNSDGSQLDAL